MSSSDVIIYSSAAAAFVFTVVFAMPLFFRKNKFPVEGRNFIVTGGSQGMGKAVACLLASRGGNVAIVARDQKKLDDALSEVIAAAKNRDSQVFAAISADLSDPEKSARAITDAETAFGAPVDVLWCVAGAATPGLFLDQGPDYIVNQMSQNYYSSAFPAHAALKSMVKNLQNPNPKSPNAARKLVFTSSLVHFAPLVGYCTYAASKFALRGLADCLRQELILYGEDKISVACCFPGTITSPGLEKENEIKHEVTKKLEESDEFQSPEEVAKGCIKGLEKGETLVVSSLTGKACRASMYGMQPKVDWFLQTAFGMVSSILWVFVSWDMESKIRKYRKEKGVPAHQLD